MIYAKGFKDRKPGTISPKYAQWVPPIKRYFQTIRGHWNCLGIILAQTASGASRKHKDDNNIALIIIDCFVIYSFSSNIRNRMIPQSQLVRKVV